MKTKSLLRRLEYAELAKLSIDGAILDVGGDRKSAYHERIKGAHTVTVANRDASTGADLVFDAEKPWPVEGSSYQAVLLMNVLEHLYDYRTALQEAHRSLSEGGRVVIAVPFLFNIHGSPDDYFRYTKSALTRMLTDAGFSDISVTPLGSGAFSVFYHLLINGMPRFVAGPVCSFLTSLDWLLARARPNSPMATESMPLGYFAIAYRRGVS